MSAVSKIFHFKRMRRMQGFSLIELVIVVVVMGIIIVTILPFFKGNVNAYIKARQGKDLMQSSRIGFNRMLAEMRMIEESVNIDYGYSNRVRFDLPAESNIEYKFENSMLKRNGEKLVEGVQSFVIHYYRANGTEKGSGFSSASDVWRIQVEMVAGDGNNNVTLRGQVSPRNFHL